jgi:hypothetical protein
MLRAVKVEIAIWQVQAIETSQEVPKMRNESRSQAI